MRIRTLILLIGILGIQLVAFGQDDLLGKGTRMIRGLASFSSIGTDNTTERAFTSLLDFSYDRFYKDHMYLGYNMSGQYENTSSINSCLLAVGPEIGYVFWTKKSQVFPFIEGGCSMAADIIGNGYIHGGYDLEAGLGVIIPIKKNFGMVIEGNYNSLKFIEVDSKVNGISLSFGFVGLLF